MSTRWTALAFLVLAIPALPAYSATTTFKCAMTINGCMRYDGSTCERRPAWSITLGFDPATSAVYDAEGHRVSVQRLGVVLYWDLTHDGYKERYTLSPAKGFAGLLEDKGNKSGMSWARGTCIPSS